MNTETTTHTPGPWHGRNNPDFRSREVFDPNGWRVADCRTTKNYEEEEANARLIAAAPELLEALDLTLHSLENWMAIADEEDRRDYDDEAVAKARAAIAKAGGK